LKNEEPGMKKQEKKSILSHIKKDSKEFKEQIKEDVKLKKEIMKSGSSKKK
jgi:hypothetical protein